MRGERLLVILGLSLALACGGTRADEGRQAMEAPTDVSLAVLLTGPTDPAPTPAPELASTPEAPPVPPPPAGMGPRELLDRAHALYEAGRLRDALTAYAQAAVADPDCAVCTARIDRLQAELHEAIVSNLDAGQRYHSELREDEAVRCWERVLMLDPDPSSPHHVRALGYLE